MADVNGMRTGFVLDKDGNRILPITHMSLIIGDDGKTILGSLDEVSSATFLMLNKNNVTRQHVDRYLASKGLTLDNQIVVTTMDLLIDFAKLGLGIACVIKEFVTEEFNKGELLEFVTEETIPERKIGYAYTNKGLANPALQKFLQGI